MPVFETTEKMYEVLGNLFRHLATHPDSGPKFRDAGIDIHFSITDPAGDIWLTRAGDVICGKLDLKPTVEMSLSGDSCHQFWMKELSLPVALAKGRIKAKGPMGKILKLLPILKPAYEAYPEIARNHGIGVS